MPISLFPKLTLLFSMNCFKFSSISKLKFFLLSEKYCLILGNSNSVSVLVNDTEQCLHYFAHNAYTHTCKYCLLFINKKEAKLMFMFRNICHLEILLSMENEKLYFTFFHLHTYVSFKWQSNVKIKRKRWLSLLETIIKIHELKSGTN